MKIIKAIALFLSMGVVLGSNAALCQGLQLPSDVQQKLEQGPRSRAK